MLLKSILLVLLLLFVVNPKSRSKSKGNIKKIHPKIDKNGQSVIAMYLGKYRLAYECMAINSGGYHTVY